MENDSKTIKEKVLTRIKNGQAEMKPRWHFALKAVLWLTGTVIVALLLLYLTSFVLFSLRQTGAWFVPIFGLRGLGLFIASIPWLLVILAGVFIAILEILVKHYAFAYRKPLLYSLLAIVLLVFVGSFAVFKARLHQGIFMLVREGGIPIAWPLYREFGLKQFREIHPGVIMEINDNGFDLENRSREVLKVIVTPQTRFPLGTDFRTQDFVVVFGRRQDDTIEALGIRKIDDDVIMMRPGLPLPDGHRRFQIPLSPRGEEL